MECGLQWFEKQRELIFLNSEGSISHQLSAFALLTY